MPPRSTDHRTLSRVQGPLARAEGAEGPAERGPLTADLIPQTAEALPHGTTRGPRRRLRTPHRRYPGAVARGGPGRPGGGTAVARGDVAGKPLPAVLQPEPGHRRRGGRPGQPPPRTRARRDGRLDGRRPRGGGEL